MSLVTLNAAMIGYSVRDQCFMRDMPHFTPDRQLVICHRQRDTIWGRFSWLRTSKRRGQPMTGGHVPPGLESPPWSLAPTNLCFFFFQVQPLTGTLKCPSNSKTMTLINYRMSCIPQIRLSIQGDRWAVLPSKSIRDRIQGRDPIYLTEMGKFACQMEVVCELWRCLLLIFGSPQSAYSFYFGKWLISVACLRLSTSDNTLLNSERTPKLWIWPA